MRALILLPLLFLSFSNPLAAQSADELNALSTPALISLATTHLSSGMTAPALQIYDIIISRDPSDVSTLYKRATVRFAAGLFGKAKDGFKEVLEARTENGGGWEKARLELVKCDIKIGDWDEGKREVKQFLSEADGKLREEGLALEAQLNHIQSLFRQASSPSTPMETCVTQCSSILSLSPLSLTTRLLRAHCSLSIQPHTTEELDSTIGDLSRASSLSASVPPHLLVRLTLLSSFFVPQGMTTNPEQGLLGVKKCLSSDPESKLCSGAFKKLKKLEKELAKARNWVDSARWGEAVVILAGGSKAAGVIADIRSLLETYTTDAETSPLPRSLTPAHSPLLNALLSTLCRSYLVLGNIRKATPACEEVLLANAEDMWGLVGRGEKLLVEEQWEEAVQALSKAFELGGRRDGWVLEKLQKAQRLLKISTAKDYYKVLGVSRDADEKTIKRAYRKATLKAHPDKEGGSEKKMAALNEAYEVLSKPELKARFDNGEDPNDPTNNQQQHQGHPFGGGFPFQGGQQFFQQGGQQFFQQGGSFRFG